MDSEAEVDGMRRIDFLTQESVVKKVGRERLLSVIDSYVPLKSQATSSLNVTAVGIEGSLINRLNNITQQLCIG